MIDMWLIEIQEQADELQTRNWYKYKYAWEVENQDLYVQHTIANKVQRLSK